MVIVVHWLGKDIKQETDEFMSSLKGRGLDDDEIVVAHLRQFLPRYDVMVSRVRGKSLMASTNKVPDDFIVYLDDPGKRFRQR